LAYITIKLGEQELGWRELEDGLVLGRQRECQVCLADLQLSRQHCRFERDDDGWAVIDLNSKNGTWYFGNRVERIRLTPGTEIQAGRTTISYHVGPPPREGRFRSRVRPIDPHEALAGTVFGAPAAGRSGPARPSTPWVAMNVRAMPRPDPAKALAESGVFAAVAELPAQQEEPELRPVRLPRPRALPRPIMLEIPAPSEPAVQAPAPAQPAPARATLLTRRRQARRRGWMSGVDVSVGLLLTCTLTITGWAVVTLFTMP